MGRLLIALTIAGAALRFSTLDVQSLWYDEAVTVGLVHLDFGSMLDHIPDSESTPPLYYVVAWLWSHVFGSGEVGIRSLSALLGTAAIPVFFLAARELTRSARVGIAVAALAAFNPLLVWYSQEARTYALLVVLAALSLLFFARLLRGVETRWLVWWTATSGLALTAHYFAGFVVVPEAAWLLWKVRPWRPVAAATAAVAAVGLALLPLAIHQQRLDLASFIRSTALPYRLLRSLKQFLTGFEAPAEVLVSVVAALIVGTGIVLALRKGGSGIRAAAALAGAGLVVPALLGLVGLDYVETRNVIVVWLPLLTVAAAGLVPSGAGRAGIGLLCALGLGTVTWVDLTPLAQRDNWRGMVEALGPPRVNRAVVITPSETGLVPFEHYDPGSTPLPPTGAVVQEVAYVSKQGRDDNAFHRPLPPRPAHLRLPGFRVVKRVYAKNFTVIVFARQQPVRVSPSFIAAYRLLSHENAALLLQRPVSAGAARGRLRAGA